MENYPQSQTYRTLLAKRQGKGFSEFEVTEILRQVLPQLAQMHVQGLVHGRISPDTLTQNPSTNQTILVQASGFTVPGYIAPEQLQTGQADVTGDIYALGVTIIVLLTGENPEVLQNYDGTWKWQDYCVVSDRLALVLEKAITNQPQFRYGNAMEMLQEIESANPVFSVPGASPTVYIDAPKHQPVLLIWQWVMIGVGTTLLAGFAGFWVYKLLTYKPELSTVSPFNQSVQSSVPVAPSQLSPSMSSPTPQSSPSGNLVETERVSFDSGSTGVTIRGNILPTQFKRYLLNCGQGQQFTVRILQGSVNVAVIDPNGSKIGTAGNGADSWQGRLLSTGDYAVEISSLNNSNYAISVNVL